MLDFLRAMRVSIAYQHAKQRMVVELCGSPELDIHAADFPEHALEVRSQQKYSCAKAHGNSLTPVRAPVSRYKGIGYWGVACQ